MKTGVQKVRKDHRDYSFPRTFGATNTFPDSFDLDAGFGFPDQNEDGLPEGCTGYTQASICEDEDKAHYKPSYTYDQTRRMAGTYPQPVACDIRTALKSTIVYGVQGIFETTDGQAGIHRRGAYYNVVDSPDLDAFDDIRSAIFTNTRSVSMATPWYHEWQNIGGNGIVPYPMTPPATWHNWKVSGWKMINGQPYLIGKSWQGKTYGDGGRHYVSRETVNKIMAVQGSGAFTVRRATPADYATVKLSMLQTALSYCYMLLAKLV